MPEIKITTETEGSNHWKYQVRVDEDGCQYDYLVTLSWSDYDLWSHGRVAPQKVIQAAFQFLLEREPAASILSKFDCSLIRRYFSEVDRLLPRMV
jgi:hypothetical protein